MSIKKTAISIVVLFLISNVLTTLWYMITDDANFVSFRRSEVNYAGLMLNHLIFVCGLVYIFPYFIQNQNTRIKAFLFGMVMAIMMFLPTGIVVRSIWQVDFNTIFAFNTLAHSFIGGILGLALHSIFNYKKVQP